MFLNINVLSGSVDYVTNISIAHTFLEVNLKSFPSPKKYKGGVSALQHPVW